MSIIKTDSALWKLPQGLDPFQASVCDAIRLSVQFIDATYERVKAALTDITLTTDRALQLGPIAVMDSWAIVDAVHRMRALVQMSPRYTERPSKELFIRRTAAVEAMRNSFQHLVSDLHKVTDSDLPVLGALTWLRPVDRDLNVLSVCTFIPGQLRSIDLSSQVLVSKMPADTTQVELWHGKTGANITMLLSAVSDFVVALERGLAQLTPGVPAAICDALVDIKLELTQDSESQSNSHAG